MPRMEVRLGPTDVGRRVVLRRLLPDPAPGRRFADTLGILLEWTADHATVQPETGPPVRVARADVVAGKPVPPRPPRRDPRVAPDRGPDLVAVMARGWPSVAVEPIGGWLLRAADGFTGRANSVAVTGDPGLPLGDALARVRAFYAARGLPPWVQAIVGSALDDELDRRGWQVTRSGGEEQVRVLVAPVPAVRRGLAAPGAAVTVSGELSAEWFAAYRDEPLTSAARHVLTGCANVGFARLATPDPTQPERPAGVARGVVTDGWIGLHALRVAPPVRRRGMAQALIGALLDWAVPLGGQWVYVQVGSANTPAIALYDRLGFRLDHAYRYRAAPPA